MRIVRLQFIALGIATVLLLANSVALADQSRPALLEISEQTPGLFAVTWKLPVLGDQPLELTPVFPKDFNPIGEPTTYAIPGAQILRRNYKTPDSSLEGKTIAIEGLSASLTDALLRITLLDGNAYSIVLRPSDPSFTIPDVSEETPKAILLGGLKLGIRGFLGNISYGLLILALCLLSGQFWSIVKVLFVFIIGHAAAMVLADLGILAFPPEIATLLCLLAILLIANSIAKGGRPMRSFLFPIFLISVCIGLSQSGVLVKSGMSKQHLLYSIFSFNLGFNASQALLAIIILAILWAVRKVKNIDKLRPAIAYAIGVAAVVIGIGTCLAPPALPASLQSAGTSTLGLPVASPQAAQNASQPSSQPSEPVMTFLVIEPYEIRLEVLLQVKDVLGEIPIETTEKKIIVPADQPQVIQDILQTIPKHFTVSIDGRPATPSLQRGEFVVKGASGILPRTQPVSESVTDALIGLTFIYSHEGLPRNVTLDWKWFPANVQKVVATLADPLGETQSLLTPAKPSINWQNRLVGFELPSIKPMEVAPSRLPLVSIALGILAIPFLIIGFYKGRRISKRLSVLLILSAVILYPFARTAWSFSDSAAPVPTQAEAKKILDRLLTNVYISFGLRDEDRVYDRLAKTVSGDQLGDIYLQSRRALELEDRGGPRVKVHNLKVLETRSVKRQADGSIAVDGVWTVGGSVSHFGHTHFRQNRYNAIVHIAPEKGVWKIHKITILENERQL